MLTKILEYLPVRLQEQHPLLSIAGAAILVLRITYLLSYGVISTYELVNLNLRVLNCI